MLRALLFDFNGVLVNDEPVHLELFRKVLEEEGLSLDEGDYYRDFLGLDDRGCLSAVLARAGRPPSPQLVTRLIARKASYYQERMRRQGFPYFPGALELVRAAAARGLMLGVVSGALHDEIEQALRGAGVRALFKCVVSADDVSEGKPDPEGYRRGLEELSSTPPYPDPIVHPHEVLAIEDSPAGLSAAAAVGLVTLGVAQTYPEDRLRDADAVVGDLAGLDLDRLERLYAAIGRA